MGEYSPKISRKRSVLFVFCVLLLGILITKIVNSKPIYYAHAYYTGFENKAEIKSLISGKAKDILITNKNSQLEIFKADMKDLNHKKTINENFENKLYAMVGEAPIREMVPKIAERDQHVAALLIGIAKKESSFGNASPSKEGKNCYNYWGLKGSGSRGQGMGYACFGSPEEAVTVVGDKIETLVNKKLDTPAKMIVWKCGSAACVGHDPVAVRKWISDVEGYFYKIVQS